MEFEKVKSGFFRILTFQELFGVTAIILFLYWLNLQHYLLFHGISEIFSIVVSFGIYILATHTINYHQNNYLTFIGISYFFVGCIDLVHTLSYSGMGIFAAGMEKNYATSFWIGSRFLESFSLLSGFLFLRKKINLRVIKFCFLFFTVCIIYSIIYNYFPICHDSKGMTNFKIYSEYFICLILLGVQYMVFKYRNEFPGMIYYWIQVSIFSTILAEMFFTLYINFYSLSNFIGHLFKAFSFYLIYKSILWTGLTKPYSLLFRDLEIHNQELERLVQEKSKLLIEKERQAQIGLMAGGIAHELKNPLCYVRLNLQMLEKRLKDQDEYRLMIQCSLKGTRIIQNICDSLRKCYRPSKVDKINIYHVLDSAIEVCKNQWRMICKEIKIVNEHNICPEFNGIENQLIQVFMNLITNSAQEIKNSGKTNGEIQIHLEETENNLKIVVSDNGPGVNENDIQKLGEMRFTTKSFSHGTGLGLTIVSEIVRNHHGNIIFRNKNQGGLEVIITLPRDIEEVIPELLEEYPHE